MRTAEHTQTGARAPSFSTVPWPVTAAAAFAVVAAMIVGGAYLMIQVQTMSDRLAHLTAQLDTLQAMNTKLNTLTTMDRTLTDVNGKLSTTNVLLRQSNAKLAAALTTADKTSAEMDQMQGRLGAMTAALRDVRGALEAMASDIGRMTQKIVHAKLLF